MTELPGTSPLPPLVFMPAQSTRTSGPAPTPTPVPHSTGKLSAARSESSISPPSSKAPKFTLPKLRFEIRNLNHAGAEAFLEAVIASRALVTSVKSVLELLYHSPDSPTTTIPLTRSVTLILRSMDGVAYTTGSDLDSDHKEIHFSLDYIHKAIPASRKAHEIMGVLTHEMVHW